MKIGALSTQQLFHAESKKVKTIGKADGAGNQLQGSILPIKKYRQAMRNVDYHFPNKLAGRIDKRDRRQEDQDMIKSIEKLEAELSDVKTDVAVIRSNYATKADLTEAKNNIIIWVVSVVILTQLLPVILKKIGI